MQLHSVLCYRHEEGTVAPVVNHGFMKRKKTVGNQPTRSKRAMGKCLEDKKAFLFPEGRRVKTISLFQAARKSYYAALLKNGVLCMVARKKPKKGLPDQFPSNADGESLAARV
jgi:hypothetical protein